MGAFYETIPQSLFKWILEQHMFWVSTAPLSASGHINISPKGGDYFGVLDERTFWYMDLTGSGSETVAHLYERGNGRITVLFNAFQGPPRILRLFGHGRVLESGTSGFDDFVKKNDVKTIPGSRAIVLVDVHQVGTSCGYSVPYYEYKEHRRTLNQVFERKDEKFKQGDETESMPRYWALKNSWSMDGLPALHVAQKARKEHQIEPLKKMVGPLAPTHYHNTHRFGLEHILLAVFLTATITALVTTYGLDTAQFIATRIPADASRMVQGPLRTML
ncbi:hypothetical protein KVR01_001880 [Diaporthe batatas]|uniref:uncharacterized protein n=1 Tax=Diaporthe batatas TaxID=748121 RepID=UPI001D05B697|nr:uncharacterized protein KVR01_001880 [Diaporthe batatas]KAG8169131.1 hypothetical protein KVR01_001880 [Diaporthe batatas]